MDTLIQILNRFHLENPDGHEFPTEIVGYDRNDLAQLFADLKFKNGAEIGTEQGEYAETIMKANRFLQLNCIDAWQVYKGYRDHTRQEKLDFYFQLTKKRLEKYTNVIFFREFSLDALKHFNDESLDFVYIDANHDFMHVANDVHFWSRKVRKGGIVAGHDYYKDDRYKHVHVRQVIDGYMKAYDIRPWFLIGDSWFFVKE